MFLTVLSWAGVGGGVCYASRLCCFSKLSPRLEVSSGWAWLTSVLRGVSAPVSAMGFWFFSSGGWLGSTAGVFCPGVGWVWGYLHPSASEVGSEWWRVRYWRCGDS